LTYLKPQLNNNLPSYYPTIGDDNEEGLVYDRQINTNLPSYYTTGVSRSQTPSQTSQKQPINSDLKAVKEASHFEELNRDSVELLKSEDITWSSVKDNPEYLEAAKRLASKRLGMDEDVEGSYALEEVLEHFNEFDVNEMVAARDYGYVSAIVADADDAQQRGDTEEYQSKIQELNDYRLMFTLKNSLPYFFQEGGRGITALGDVIGGIAQAPST
jgi:hypothetical protein